MILNTLSVRSKLLLSVILPIAGIIYFTFINIDLKYQKMQESSKVHKIILLNTKISALVHELQKERGMSSGFVSSQGANFVKELSEQKNLPIRKCYN